MKVGPQQLILKSSSNRSSGWSWTFEKIKSADPTLILSFGLLRFRFSFGLERIVHDHPANRRRELFQMLQTAFRTIWERLSSGPPRFVRANLKLEPFSDEKGHLLAVFWFRILVRNLEFVRFNNLKVTQQDHTIACDNRKNRRHFMKPVLFVVRPFLYVFARLV